MTLALQPQPPSRLHRAVAPTPPQEGIGTTRPLIEKHGMT